MNIRYFNHGSHWPHDGVRTAWYKFRHFMDNPTYFDPDGIWIYCGAQGSGKTLSAVNTLYNLVRLYPRARVISNMELSGIPTQIEPFTGYEQITNETNGIEGIIFLIDEIHVLWNSLESKDIPITEMATFCQMRKDRRVIIGTSQVYGRIAKPIREQLKYLIDCHCLFGVCQSNVICDPTESIEKNGIISPAVIGNEFFFHTPELYSRFETLNKIRRPDRYKKVTLPDPNNSPFFKEV